MAVNRRWAISVLLLCGTTGTVWAAAGVPAQQGRGDAVRVSAYPGGLFRLTAGGRAASVNLNDQVAGCLSGTYDSSDPNSRPVGSAPDTRVLDLVRRGGYWYLTMQTTAQGNCNVQGQCGASVSTTLLWLKLSAALKPVAKQSEVLEDCLQNTELESFSGQGPTSSQDLPPEPKLQLQKGALLVVSLHSDDDTKMDTRRTVRYQHTHPERGLSVTSEQVARK